MSIPSQSEFESLLNTTPLNYESATYDKYVKHGGSLRFGTWLRKSKPMEFEKRREGWNLDTLSTESQIDDALIAEAVLADEANGLINPFRILFATNKNELTLELPPLNEAEFMAKIAYKAMFPEDVTENPDIISYLTKLIYNISDRGRLHDALSNWVADSLMNRGKAKNSTEASTMAEDMLATYTDYNDIIKAVSAPVKRKPVPDAQ